MTLFLALMVANGSVNCAVPPTEIARQLTLSYEKFDVDEQPSAWRQLNANGCTDQALQMLAKYEASNAARLTAEQRSELAFHAGQALAFGGRDSDAIPHFERALSFGGSADWTNYVGATIAFLKRDGTALRKARDRYASIAPDSMRLKFLDGFIACPNDSYMKAAHCAL